MTPIEQTAKALDNYARRWMQLAEDISGSTSFAIGSSVYRRLAYYGSGGKWGCGGSAPDLDILVFDVPDIKRVADCARQRGLCITTVGALYGKANSLRLNDGHSNFQCDIIYGPDFGWYGLDSFEHYTPLSCQAVYYALDGDLSGCGNQDAIAAQFSIQADCNFTPSIEYPSVQEYAKRKAAALNFKWLDEPAGGKHKCYCDIRTLMGKGCKCGGY